MDVKDKFCTLGVTLLLGVGCLVVRQVSPNHYLDLLRYHLMKQLILFHIARQMPM